MLWMVIATYNTKSFEWNMACNNEWHRMFSHEGHVNRVQLLLTVDKARHCQNVPCYSQIRFCMKVTTKC